MRQLKAAKGQIDGELFIVMSKTGCVVFKDIFRLTLATLLAPQLEQFRHAFTAQQATQNAEAVVRLVEVIKRIVMRLPRTLITIKNVRDLFICE